MAALLDDRITGRNQDARSLDVPVQYYGGRVRIFSPAKFAFDAAQNDTVELGALPAHARLVEALSLIRHSAFGSSVTLSVGFKDDARDIVKKADDSGAGITGKTAALASALDVAAASTKSMCAAIAIADSGKMLWELAGLERDPKVTLTLIATLGGSNPASGTIVIEQGWVAD